jgi:PAS domain-containing protein
MANGFVSEGVDDPGIFTWSLDTDVLYADNLIALLFGLRPADTISGLPLSTYIARIHPEDREIVGQLIAQAVRSGLPYHAEYRVLNADDDPRWVIAMGRCFRDRNGNPSHYAGIVYPLDLMISAGLQ